MLIDKTTPGVVCRKLYHSLHGVVYCRAALAAGNYCMVRRIEMVLEKVKAILSEQVDVEEDTITADTNISEDLEADSLDVVDLLMSIEDEFEIEVPDTEIENLKTVGQLVKYIEDHV